MCLARTSASSRGIGTVRAEPSVLVGRRAVPVDLEAERDLGLVQVVDGDIRPGEAAQLRDPGAGEGGDREQRPVWLG